MTSSLEFIFCQYISSIIFIYIKILHLPSVVMETSTNKILWFCSQLVVGAFFCYANRTYSSPKRN